MNKDPFFRMTRWTLIRHAKDPHHPGARQALEELINIYWQPIYAFIRRRGHSPEDAEDLTQGFLAYACEHQTFAKAEPTDAKGAPRLFRSFVLGCLNNYLSDDFRHRTAAKRGGTTKPLSLDLLAAEERYAAEPIDDLSPDKLFDHKLAVEIARSVLQELKAEAAAGDKAERLAAVLRFLGKDGPIESYRDLFAQTGIPVGTLKSDRHQFSIRARQIRWDMVRELVDREDEVEAEIIALEDALSNTGSRPG
jgi:DNA-directed RNA polymerase specialized sigma24 family protein